MVKGIDFSVEMNVIDPGESTNVDSHRHGITWVDGLFALSKNNGSIDIEWDLLR